MKRLSCVRVLVSASLEVRNRPFLLQIGCHARKQNPGVATRFGESNQTFRHDNILATAVAMVSICKTGAPGTG